MMGAKYERWEQEQAERLERQERNSMGYGGNVNALQALVRAREDAELEETLAWLEYELAELAPIAELFP
jgi:hypothetical protein